MINRITQAIERSSSSLTIGFILLYSVAFIVISLNRFWQYQNYYFDFGIFDMAIWQVSQFNLPLIDHYRLGNEDIIVFADHFNPSIFLLSPIYWVTSRSEVLLIVQVILVGVSALLGFLIAKNQLKDKIAIFSLVLAYLGYVGLQNALISDFHEATIAVFPLMLLFWSFFKKRWLVYFISLAVLLGLKESFAGLGVALGIYILLKSRAFLNQSLLTILLSLAWGIIAIKVIIPFFSGGVYLYTPQAYPQTLAELINRFLSPDQKWKTIFYTYATFGFLPIFDLKIFLAVFENFFERFILSGTKGQNLGMHYNAPLAPLMFVGALTFLRYIEHSKIFNRHIWIFSSIIIFNVIILQRVILHGPLGLVYNPVFYEQNQRVKYVDDFLKGFPKSGLIMTQNDLAVRLTHGQVKLLRENYVKLNPDYIMLNLTPGQNPNSFYPLGYEKTKEIKGKILNDPEYGVKKFAEELYLFSKKRTGSFYNK